LTERRSQQSIRGSKWDYVGAETDGEKISGEERKAKGENNKLVTTVGDGLNICRTFIKFQGSPMVTICTTSLTVNTSTFCPHTVFKCFVWI
jgi:hypothetical protein